MLTLVRAIGLIVLGMGLTITADPRVLNIVINFWKEGNRIYGAGAARLIFGVIFLMAASSCRHPVVITALGILMIIGAALVFALGPARIKAILGWWEQKPPLFVRLLGLAPAAIGAAILYSA
ncbi:MAG: hypothetical protein WC592_04085 [Candidatus Omnitrophota bacterium]|nr:hypothetical protein [Candidatus Omnitrophota bacterium]